MTKKKKSQRFFSVSTLEMPKGSSSSSSSSTNSSNTNIPSWYQGSIAAITPSTPDPTGALQAALIQQVRNAQEPNFNNTPIDHWTSNNK